MKLEEIIDRYSSKREFLFPVMALLAFFMSFWMLGSEPLHAWDESRNGVNAVEMIQNHDYINLYYGGQPDTWNAKPPLMIWMIVGSYKVFGTNEFALRFPSALAIFLSLLVLFAIIRLYGSEWLAFSTCLILMSVNGLIGSHVGRTGDFDALVILFLLITIYFALKYIDFNNANAIFLGGISLGLAFYTKGLATLIIIPGLVLYLLITRNFIRILKDYRFWIAALIFVAFVLSWFLLVSLYGLKFKESFYGSENSFETMWKYDVLQRLTEGFSNGHVRNYAFFFNYLDARFNLWNYVFYLVLAGGLYKLIKKDWNIQTEGKSPLFKLALFSCCIWATIGIFLTFSVETHNWYLAPALPFVAITTTIGCSYFMKHFRFVGWLLIVLLLVTFTRKAIDLSNPGEYPVMLSNNEKTIQTSQKIVCLNIDRQDYVCYMKMRNPEVETLNCLPDSLASIKGPVILFLKKEDYAAFKQTRNNLTILGTDDQYIISQWEK